jgi:hypothetical protein
VNARPIRPKPLIPTLVLMSFLLLDVLNWRMFETPARQAPAIVPGYRDQRRRSMVLAGPVTRPGGQEPSRLNAVDRAAFCGTINSVHEE